MFTKLLKYEWKSSGGILGILSLAALGVGVLGAIVLRIITGLTTENVDGLMAGTLTAMTLLLFFLILALVAYAVGTEILLLYRFYKSKFTDEGYLTFTLPVSSRQIFLASFLNIGVWSLIASLVVSVSIGMIFFLGVDWEVMVGPGAIEEMMTYYGDIYEVQGATGQLWLSLLSSVVSFVSGIVTMMTCVTVGAVVAKKHKVLAALGIYYGVSMLNSMISAIFTVVLMIAEVEYADTAASLLGVAVQLALTVIGFFLSTYLMEKKLNLP